MKPLDDVLPAHSVYGASSAHRWTACPGSVAATALIPETSSPYAQEGTALHAVAASCLASGQDAIEFVDRTVEGIEIDEDHATAVQVYLDTIRADQKRAGGTLLIEKKFHIKKLHPKFFGTADCVRRGGTDRVMSVYDAKFGRGEIVEVRRPDGIKPNLQLGYYALGALKELEIPERSPIDRIELVLVQPRAYHPQGPVRRAFFEWDQILHIGTELKAAVKECEKPNPLLVAGPHCKFCRAAPTCPELRNRTLAVANLEFSDDPYMDIKGIVPPPASLTPKQLANVLYAADELETWMTAVRAYAHQLAQQETIPGWKLVQKKSRRKWIDEGAAAKELLFGFGLNEEDIYETKLKSPAQAEKLLAKKDRALTEFTSLCPPVSTGLTLVHDSNPRDAVVPIKIAYDDGTSTPEDAEW